MRATLPPAPPPEPTGETRFGELTLVERIGVGGMAEVFRAREPRAVGEPRTIVVKRMLPHIAREPGAARMFEAEAELGQRVVHPNVVRVLGQGIADDTPYLSLELVPGVDLWLLLRWLDDASEALPPELSVFVARELLAGLHAVHEATDEASRLLGIVHGDVSPSNVLLSVHGDVKLGDFGIAQARLRSSFPQAASGRMRGKLAYLAPEQVRGEAADRRADVFAAAAVIAELLLGTPLFARDSELSTLLAVRDARLDRLVGLPDGLDEVLRHALARDPSDRVATAAALRDGLAGFVTTPDSTLRQELGELVARASGTFTDAPQPLTRDEITMQPEVSEHWVRFQAGGEAGPWSFAQLVEAVTVGRLGPDDETRLGSGPWHRLAEVEGLAEHLPKARIEVGRRESEPPRFRRSISPAVASSRRWRARPASARAASGSSGGATRRRRCISPTARRNSSHPTCPASCSASSSSRAACSSGESSTWRWPCCPASTVASAIRWPRWG